MPTSPKREAVVFSWSPSAPNDGVIAIRHQESRSGWSSNCLDTTCRDPGERGWRRGRWTESLRHASVPGPSKVSARRRQGAQAKPDAMPRHGTSATWSEVVDLRGRGRSPVGTRQIPTPDRHGGILARPRLRKQTPASAPHLHSPGGGRARLPESTATPPRARLTALARPPAPIHCVGRCKAVLRRTALSQSGTIRHTA